MSHPRLLWTSSLVLLILTATTLGVLYGASLTARPVTATEPGVTPTLTIAGEARLKLAPDRVKLHITITAEERTAAAATREAADIFSQLLAQLGPFGLGKPDLETTAYNIHPVYDYPPHRAPQVRAYMAQHTLVVTVKAAGITQLGAKAGQVIDAVVAAGVTQVGGLSFTVADEALATLRKEALRAAVTDARAKADTLAGALNLRITGVQTVKETSFQPPPPIMLQRGVAESKAMIASELVPGSFEVVAMVQVAFTAAPVTS